MPDMTTIAHLITQARKDRSLTQQQLAHEVGCAVRSVQNWEAGTRAVSPKHLASVSRVLGLDLAELVVSR